jgi:hypothetical protein
MLSNSFDRKTASQISIGLRYYLKERLEGIQFLTLAQLHQRALACEAEAKKLPKLLVTISI